MASLRLIFLTVLWLLPMGFTHAQQPPWRRANGTEGIFINDIAVSPGNPDTLYAIGLGNFLISADRGENWQITTLLQGYQTPGRHEIIWNAEGLVGGIYFYTK